VPIIDNKTENQNINFCFALDENYVWPFLVSIFSAKKHKFDLKAINIIYDKSLLSSESRFFISKFLKNLDISVVFFLVKTPEGYTQKNHISKSSFLRLLAPSQIGGLIIYFDCDVLFLRNWHRITNFTSVLKTQNLSVGARRHWGQISSNFNRAIIESNNRYFNSGVLILNSSRWRYERLDLKCEKAILEYSKLLFEFADQCVLNYVLKGKYLDIHKDFNATPGEFRVRRTKLLHFAGSIKPWTLKINTSTRIISPIECISLRDIPILQRYAFKMYRRLELEVVNFINKKNILSE